ncbi:MAG: DNA-binding transcriptional regulator [Verrucomicrobiota bacterium]
MSQKPSKVLMLLGMYDPNMHRGIAKAAKEWGWHLDINMMKTFRLPERWTGDGIICSLNSERRLAEYILNSKVPCVDLSIWRSDLPIHRVVADNRRIGMLAADHLSTYGHKHFAWYAYDRTPFGDERFRGYRERLAKVGLNPERLDGRGAHRIDVVLQRLRKLSRPCAIFAKSDLDASWIMSACLQEGYRVPEDFAILGVDNNELICELLPTALSSVSQNQELIGYRGANVLQSLMTGKRISQKTHFVEPGGVEVRQSTDAIAVEDIIVRQTLETMNAKYRHDIEIGQLAAQAGIHRNQLEARFKKTMHTTIHQKLIEIRIAKASELLKESLLSVEDIAVLTGFCHAPHLSRVFKTRRGISPLHYRKSFSR